MKRDQNGAVEQYAPGTGAAIVVVTLLISVAATVLFVLNRNSFVQDSWGAAAGVRNTTVDWAYILIQAVFLPWTCAGIGFLIEWRRKGHGIGRILILFALLIALNTAVLETTAFTYFTAAQPFPGSGWIAWVANWMWIAPFVLFFVAVALFPNGRFLSPRWRTWILGSLTLYTVPTLIATTLEPTFTSAFGVNNPFVERGFPAAYDVLFTLFVVMLIVTAIIVLAATVQRFRLARHRERAQMKWMLYAMAMATALIIGGSLFAQTERWATVGEIAVACSVIFLPVGIGAALLRYRLYDIDIIIRRTLLYSVLSAILAGVYFGAVTSLQSVMRLMGGIQSTPIIIVSTLVIAGLFSPLQRLLQREIDRRFFRSQYDAQQLLAQFSETARDEVDLDRLSAELLETIDSAMQPTHISLWLREETG